MDGQGHRPRSGARGLVIVRTPDGAQTRAHQVPHSVRREGCISFAGESAGHPHIAFVVRDLDTIINGLRANGIGLIGEVQDYEDTFRLCYVRGPEGRIVELAEQIGSR